MIENRRHITLGCRVIFYKHSEDAISAGELEPGLFDEVCERVDYLEQLNAEMLTAIKAHCAVCKKTIDFEYCEKCKTARLIKKVEGRE